MVVRKPSPVTDEDRETLTKSGGGSGARLWSARVGRPSFGTLKQKEKEIKNEKEKNKNKRKEIKKL